MVYSKLSTIKINGWSEFIRQFCKGWLCPRWQQNLLLWNTYFKFEFSWCILFLVTFTFIIHWYILAAIPVLRIIWTVWSSRYIFNSGEDDSSFFLFANIWSTDIINHIFLLNDILLHNLQLNKNFSSFFTWFYISFIFLWNYWAILCFSFFFYPFSHWQRLFLYLPVPFLWPNLKINMSFWLINLSQKKLKVAL